MLFGVRVIVVVPAFCEALRIGRVVRSMPAFVDRVIVVDDASSDETAEHAKSAAEPPLPPAGEGGGEGCRHSRVEVIRHSKNRGVGAAIATGYRAALLATNAPRDAIAVMAGDGQMDPADLERLIEPIAKGDADYVKGDRFQWPNVERDMPALRRIGGEFLSRLTTWAIGVRISDSQCGYTALSRRACEELDLDGLWPCYGYPNDLLGQLIARRLRIAERPVRPVYAGENSGIRAYHALPIAFLIARARWRRRASRSSVLPATPKARAQ